MRLARLLPLSVVLLIVSCFSAQADEPTPTRPDVRSSPSASIDLDLGPQDLPPKGPPRLESALLRLVEAPGAAAGSAALASASPVAVPAPQDVDPNTPVRGGTPGTDLAKGPVFGPESVIEDDERTQVTNTGTPPLAMDRETDSIH